MVKDSTSSPPDISDANNTVEPPSQRTLSIAFAVIEGESVMVISLLVEVAHYPKSGLKSLVKIPVVVLSIVFGFQIPVNPSNEVVGNTSTLPV